MVAPLIVAGAGALVSGIAGAAGAAAAAGDRAEAERLLKEGYEQYGNVFLEELQKVAPELLGPSAMAGVSPDPRLRASQLKALGAFDEIVDSGGLMMEDRAALNELNMNAEQAASGRQAAIMENMAARGALNSGAALSAQLANAQAGAQRGQQRAMDVAGQSQRRVLDALVGGGRLAGDVRGQDFSEGSDKARAADEIARFNANARTGAARYNNDITERNNQQRLTKSDRKLRGYENRANIKAGNAAQTQQVYSGIGSAANAGAGAASNYLAEDEYYKKYGGR